MEIAAANNARSSNDRKSNFRICSCPPPAANNARSSSNGAQRHLEARRELQAQRASNPKIEETAILKAQVQKSIKIIIIENLDRLIHGKVKFLGDGHKEKWSVP